MSVASILSDPSYPELKNFVLSFTGLSYYTDKDEDLASRIARRFAARQIAGCADYLHLLHDRAAAIPEMDGLIGELTIGETYFFRQPEHFDILRDTLLPELLQRNQASRSLRIWSAGCATGAEPYSINMLLELAMAQRLAGWDASILATDINNEFLARAREARFAEWAFRQTPEWIKLRCFLREGKLWTLRPEFRQRTTFQHHNLASGEPLPRLPRPFDVIFCRNVMIYLSTDLLRRLAARFYDELAPGGFLLVGHAEPNAEIFAQFARLAAGHVAVYRKPLDSAPVLQPQWRANHVPPHQPLPAPLAVAAPRPPRLQAVRETEATPPADLAEVRLLADRGEWNQAATLGRRLTAADPLNAPAHFTMGLILEHTGSCLEALTALRRAIYLDRGFALAHYHLGTCLQNDRQPERARKAFRNVLQLLNGRSADETVEHGDGLTVGELKELARFHVQLLGGA